MQFIQNILSANQILTASLLSCFIAQVLKTIINFVLLGKFQLERMWGDGGMPSAHSATVCAMVIATAVTFPLQIFLLDAYNLGYLQTIIFILVIAVLVQLIEITLKKYVPALYQSLGVYLPLITTNCCVLGVTILAVQDYSAVVAEFGFGLAYAEALVCAAGAGVGFLVAMLLFCGVRSRVEAANPPESFKGLPITLVSAAITSLSFMGFGGLVENIINAIL